MTPPPAATASPRSRLSGRAMRFGGDALEAAAVDPSGATATASTDSVPAATALPNDSVGFFSTARGRRVEVPKTDKAVSLTKKVLRAGTSPASDPQEQHKVSRPPEAPIAEAGAGPKPTDSVGFFSTARNRKRLSVPTTAKAAEAAGKVFGGGGPASTVADERPDDSVGFFSTALGRKRLPVPSTGKAKQAAQMVLDSLGPHVVTTGSSSLTTKAEPSHPETATGARRQHLPGHRASPGNSGNEAAPQQKAPNPDPDVSASRPQDSVGFFSSARGMRVAIPSSRKAQDVASRIVLEGKEGAALLIPDEAEVDVQDSVVTRPSPVSVAKTVSCDTPSVDPHGPAVGNEAAVPPCAKIGESMPVFMTGRNKLKKPKATSLATGQAIVAAAAAEVVKTAGQVLVNDEHDEFGFAPLPLLSEPESYREKPQRVSHPMSLKRSMKAVGPSGAVRGQGCNLLPVTTAAGVPVVVGGASRDAAESDSCDAASSSAPHSQHRQLLPVVTAGGRSVEVSLRPQRATSGSGGAAAIHGGPRTQRVSGSTFVAPRSVSRGVAHDTVATAAPSPMKRSRKGPFRPPARITRTGGAPEVHRAASPPPSDGPRSSTESTAVIMLPPAGRPSLLASLKGAVPFGSRRTRADGFDVTGSINGINAGTVVFGANGFPASVSMGAPSVFPGADDCHKTLLEHGCDPKEASLAWVRNHFRWIVWKLAALERSFPSQYPVGHLCRNRVVSQLLYRYEREVNRSEFPCLRKIMQRDELAGRYVVLCVADVVAAEGGADHDNGRATLLLTDGWYCIRARLDAFLGTHVTSGKIFVGQKLRICGARLVDADDGVHPLETAENCGDRSASPALMLHVNGVRRARWHQKLGFQKRKSFRVSTDSLVAGGGPAPGVEIVVYRCMPPRVLATGADGVKRSMSLEEDARDRQTEQEELQHKLQARAAEMERAWEDEFTSMTRRMSRAGRAADGDAEVEAKRRRVEEDRRREMDEAAQQLSARRNATKFTSVLVLDCAPLRAIRDSAVPSSAVKRPGMFSPDAATGHLMSPAAVQGAAKHPTGEARDVVELTLWHDVPVKEGSRYLVFGLDVQAADGGGKVRLKASRSNLWHELPHSSQVLQRAGFHPRDCTKLAHISPRGTRCAPRCAVGLYDVAGVVLRVGNMRELPRSSGAIDAVDLFLGDDTGAVMAIEVHGPVSTAVSRLSLRAAVSLSNVDVSGFDSRLGILIGGWVDASQFHARGSPPHLRARAAELSAWVKSKTGSAEVSRLIQALGSAIDSDGGPLRSAAELPSPAVTRGTPASARVPQAPTPVAPKGSVVYGSTSSTTPRGAVRGQSGAGASAPYTPLMTPRGRVAATPVVRSEPSYSRQETVTARARIESAGCLLQPVSRGVTGGEPMGVWTAKLRVLACTNPATPVAAATDACHHPLEQRVTGTMGSASGRVLQLSSTMRQENTRLSLCFNMRAGAEGCFAVKAPPAPSFRIIQSIMNCDPARASSPAVSAMLQVLDSAICVSEVVSALRSESGPGSGVSPSEGQRPLRAIVSQARTDVLCGLLRSSVGSLASESLDAGVMALRAPIVMLSLVRGTVVREGDLEAELALEAGTAQLSNRQLDMLVEAAINRGASGCRTCADMKPATFRVPFLASEWSRFNKALTSLLAHAAFSVRLGRTLTKPAGQKMHSVGDDTRASGSSGANDAAGGGSGPEWTLIGVSLLSMSASDEAAADGGAGAE